MDQPPPNEGVNFYLPWSILEYVVTGTLGAGAAVAAWVWRLAWRINQLEEDMQTIKDTMRETNARNESRYLEMRNELKDMHDDMPNRRFIEDQIGRLEQRLDRMIDRDRP